MSEDAPPPRGPLRAVRRAVDGLRTGGGEAALAGRRALRVTLAASTGFLVCLYGLDEPVAALYALFSSVAMAALSRIPGTGRQRAAVLLRVLPVAWLLVAAGTALAGRTWTAVAGMLAVGFVLAFAAVAGPRLAGAAPGLQLMYILPCFPPYAPDELPARLVGTAVGFGLLVAAEAVLLPEPRARPYRLLTADAAATAARTAAALARDPGPLSGASARAATAVGESLRARRVPAAERPAGPGLRDRAEAHAGWAARALLARLTAAPRPPAGARSVPRAEAGLLAEIARSAAQSSHLLATGEEPAPRRLERSLRAFRSTPPDATDAGGAPDGAGGPRGRDGADTAAAPRRRAALAETAEAAVALSTAARLAVCGRSAVTAGWVGGPAFAYAGQSTGRLYWRRIAGHAGPRSVYFQNALRISLALAVARAVAGAVSLPHGFWAMLAALSLTRTTFVQTGRTIRLALTGTVVGAAAAGALLAVVGHHGVVYAVLLPPLMAVTFFLGPLLGVGWAQALFTVVVAAIFGQLAPASWQLAEVRLLDVLTGSLIGLLCGLLAWPHGARTVLPRDTAMLLDAVAAAVTATTAALAGAPATATFPAPGATPGTARDPTAAVTHALPVVESAYAQFQDEPRPVADLPGPDWQAALIAGHHARRGSTRLLERPVRPGPDAAERAWLLRSGDHVAGAYTAAAARLADRRRRGTPAPGPATPPPPPPPPPPGGAPFLYEVAAWLEGLTHDLARLDPHPLPAPDHDGDRDGNRGAGPTA
ncbi:FUSC family protein [Streptomyces sp. BE20]|uniref:FUSC family protein n=1 Tax=Streptomyces sp. BE20 TaxID=3002525 RepID=UPI002E78EA7C|nr:FUSC family protein [Streptomyces sp. BE20]MEE1821838.1 FUSC family protein [Streptomyces sp. BE20]